MNRLMALLIGRPAASRRSPGGFTLVDVLIAMVLLLIAIASSAALAVQLARTLQTDERITAAANLADYKLEELRNFEYVDVLDGADEGTLNSMGNSPGEYTRSWAVTTNSPDVGLKTIVVGVTWTQWNGQRTYELTGVIGQ